VAHPLISELHVCQRCTEDEPNWPDHLDVETGRFTYYGDNRRPGHQLHDTPKGGNRLLQQVFDDLHSGKRAAIPPICIFTSTGNGRDISFRGLAAPGAPSLQALDDLVAIWKTANGSRFQNYRATFTVLNADHVGREWISDILTGQPLSKNAPSAWWQFVSSVAYNVLAAPRALAYRKPSQQKPVTATGVQIIEAIHQHFQNRPYDFEKCAVELARMMDRNVVDCDLTRPWRDGGRDAVRFYRIGPPSDPIRVEFALEAKCYKLANGNGGEANIPAHFPAAPSPVRDLRHHVFLE
jgi:Restriction endonuclease AspBHI N-terminal